MGVFIDDAKLFYAPIPKVACTSIKHMFFELENDFTFQKFKASSKGWHIHNFYPGSLREKYQEGRIKDYRRITMVREPVKRFLSAYSNRVIFHNRANEKAVAGLGRFRKVTPNPELDEFIDRFDRYMKIRDISWHCRPMVDFVGSDPGYFHAVYGIQQMDEFIEDVSNTVGKQVEVGRLQTGGPKISPDVLTAKQREKIENYYAADYKAYAQYF
ncbi:MAG: sulfotransferase family 2 domain-containing protein [Erythrobacter sp.]|nr:sulfotransferase family 2 domain-containing protein [Erythrobacter sp.]